MFSARTTALLLLAASIAILGTALGFQYLGGLQPCPLCIWQRWPYVATALIAAAALALPPAGRRAALALCGAVFLAGAGIAAFHAGVEQGWWEGLAACSGSLPTGASVAEVRDALMNQPVVRCDEIPWSLFGLSMAAWNLLLSLGLAALSFIAAAPQRTMET